MVASSKDLSMKLEAKAASDNTGLTVYDLLEKHKPAIERALPNVGITAERLVRILQTQIRINPKLASCSPASLLGAVMFTAQLGLEPGPLGQAYLVPLMNNKSGKLECNFWLGYKGMVTLAYRSGGILIDPYEIHEGDKFQFDYGSGKVEHFYYFGKERGPIVGFWSKAQLPNGLTSVRVMTKAEVDTHRQRSRAKDDGPWVSDYGPMGMKTCIRVHMNYLPLASDTQSAFAADETAMVFTPDEGIIGTTEAPIIDVEAQEEGTDGE